MRKWDGAIVCADINEGGKASDPDDYTAPTMVEFSLGDALYLAEKCTAYPRAREIEVLDDYLDRFLLDDLQNPLDGAIGCVFPFPGAVASSYGRAQVYPLVFNLFDSIRPGLRTAASRALGRPEAPPRPTMLRQRGIRPRWPRRAGTGRGSAGGSFATRPRSAARSALCFKPPASTRN